MRYMRRLDSLLLAGVGVLLVHQGAYVMSSLAGVKVSVSHGHLETAWLIGSLTAILALARAVTRSLRSRHFDQSPPLSLTAWMLFGYLGMEATERVANGLSAFSLLGEPVFWIGLAIAPLVAMALHWSMRTVARVVADYASRPDARLVTPQVDPSLAATSVTLPPQIFQSFTVSRRGPPLAFE